MVDHRWHYVRLMAGRINSFFLWLVACAFCLYRVVRSNFLLMVYDLSAIKPYICLSCVAGSKAYGLDTPESDDDVKGVYLAPPVDMLCGCAPKVVQDVSHDVQYTELGEFMHQLELNNSGALELWACIGGVQEIFCADWLRRFLASRRVLSKRCYHTYTGNALAQLKRIRSTHAKAVMEPPTPATLLDFAVALQAGLALPLGAWLSQHALALQDVVAKPVGRDLWALFRQRSKTGLFGADGTCVARPAVEDDAPFLAYMHVDTEAFSSHCHRVRQYNDWQASRNAARLKTDAALPPGEGEYDVKHVMHIIRLLHTAEEIATEGCIRVLRTHDNAFLRKVRAGFFPLSELESLIEHKIGELKSLFDKSDLPSEPDLGDWKRELAILRLELYDEKHTARDSE